MCAMAVETRLLVFAWYMHVVLTLSSPLDDSNLRVRKVYSRLETKLPWQIHNCWRIVVMCFIRRSTDSGGRWESWSTFDKLDWQLVCCLRKSCCRFRVRLVCVSQLADNRTIFHCSSHCVVNLLVFCYTRFVNSSFSKELFWINHAIKVYGVDIQRF